MIHLQRTTPFIASVAVMALLVTSHPAEAKSFWQVFFGKEEKQVGPPPEETLRAPFVSGKIPEGKDPLDKNLKDMYGKASQSQALESVKNMDQPNISTTYAAGWAAEVVTESLTLDPQTFDALSKKLSKKFIPYAMQEYNKYLETTNALSTLQKSGMTLHAMATSTGIVSSEGALDGTYHWVVKVPILTSYYLNGVKSIDKSMTTQSQNLLVEVQLGRVIPENGDDNGVRVEHWRVTSSESE